MQNSACQEPESLWACQPKKNEDVCLMHNKFRADCDLVTSMAYSYDMTKKLVKMAKRAVSYIPQG